MRLKRIISSLLGFPFVAALLIFGSRYVVDIAFAIIAMIALKEYFHAFAKKSNPVTWVRIFIMCLYSFYTCNT